MNRYIIFDFDKFYLNEMVDRDMKEFCVGLEQEKYIMLGGTLVDNMEHANEVPESARFKLRFFRTLSNLSIFSSINTTLRFLDITKLIREKAYQYSGEMYDCRCGSAFSIFITWNNQDQIWYVSCEDRLNYYACFLEPFRLGL